MVAAYEYANQPYSLTARLAPRKTRISVDPTYVLMVDRDVVRLEGKLKYAVRGAKIATLDVAMPGWELDEIGPDNLVVPDAVTLIAVKSTFPWCSLPPARWKCNFGPIARSRRGPSRSA